MISVRGPKMTGRQSLIICALTLSGPGALLSGRDLAFFLSCHGPEIKRLIDGREVDTDLLRDRYTAFLGQVQRDLCGISTDSCKKLAELICYGFHIFWINLPFVDFERESAINYHPERTRIFLKQSHFFECVVSLSHKKGLAQSTASRVWWNRVMKSRFHEILDFLVDKTTGSATNLNRFHGSMDV